MHLAQWEAMDEKEMHLGQYTSPHPTSRPSMPSSTQLDSSSSVGVSSSHGVAQIPKWVSGKGGQWR